MATTTLTERDRLLATTKPIAHAMLGTNLPGHPTVAFIIERDAEGYRLEIRSSKLAGIQRLIEVLGRPQVVGL
jgi:hypothetical protein